MNPPYFTLAQIRNAREQTLQFFRDYIQLETITIDMSFDELGIGDDEDSFLIEAFANSYNIQDCDEPLVSGIEEITPGIGCFLFPTLPIMISAQALANFLTKPKIPHRPLATWEITRNKRIQNYDHITVGDFAASMLYGKFVKREKVEIRISAAG